MSALTETERAIMWSALGWKAPDVDPAFMPYRNRYYAHDNSPAAETWRELAKRGLAHEDTTGRLALFWVSAMGLDVLGVRPERRVKLEGYELGERA